MLEDTVDVAPLFGGYKYFFGKNGNEKAAIEVLRQLIADQSFVIKRIRMVNNRRLRTAPENSTFEQMTELIGNTNPDTVVLAGDYDGKFLEIRVRMDGTQVATTARIDEIAMLLELERKYGFDKAKSGTFKQMGKNICVD